MKTAIYIRVSTEEQATEGYSISAQKQKLKAYCIAQDWEVVGFYVDEGISAKNMERPQLQQMIRDIKAGKVECVLVYRLDRLTRSVLDLYKLLEIFDKNNCKFKSATEVYDTTTAMGRMFITIVAALAQWERENMGERISMGFSEKVRQGKYALNFRPFGYDLDIKTGKLSINPHESKIVRLIIDLYIEGYGANRICKYLNERNIKTKAGNNWNDKPLMQLLKNPLYYGAIRWNDFVVEKTHEPIVTKEEFNMIQDLITSRRSAEPRRVSSPYIFSGKLKCNNCGNPLVGYYTSGKLVNGETMKYMQYRCLRKKTGECHGSRSISELKLDEAFIAFIEKHDFSELFEKAALVGEEILNKHDESPKVNVEKLESELTKIQNRKKKWQYAWSDNLMSDEDFRKRMLEANKAEEEILKELDSVNVYEDNPIVNYNKNEIIEALKDIRRNWNSLDTSEKKNLVDSIISQVHVDYVDNKLYVKDIDII